jgi:hypothetical protein
LQQLLASGMARWRVSVRERGEGRRCESLRVCRGVRGELGYLSTSRAWPVKVCVQCSPCDLKALVLQFQCTLSAASCASTAEEMPWRSVGELAI